MIRSKVTLKPIFSDLRRIHLNSIKPEDRKRVYKEILSFAMIVLVCGYITYPCIFALIFPIQYSGDYGILSGIFHGFVFIENLLLKIFDHNRLFVASGQENAYYTSYYIAKYIFLFLGIRPI